MCYTQYVPCKSTAVICIYVVVRSLYLSVCSMTNELCKALYHFEAVCIITVSDDDHQ